MTFVDAKVEIQGDSLVVQNAETGNCLVVEVNRLFDYNPHEENPYDRLEGIFGKEAFDHGN